MSYQDPVDGHAGDRIRQSIIFEAARLLHEGRESSVGKAKARAARSTFRGYIKPENYPTDAEVASHIVQFEIQKPRDGGDCDVIHSRFDAYAAFLRPLERVEMPRRLHPERDALYHSLQVFSLTREQAPYDEELQTAALLHDIGWAIDPWNASAVGLSALEGLITERTQWLLENLPAANGRFDGTLGTRARNRLAASDDFAELMILSDCDQQGRVPGAEVPTLEAALDSLRELSGDDLSEEE